MMGTGKKRALAVAAGLAIALAGILLVEIAARCWLWEPPGSRMGLNLDQGGDLMPGQDQIWGWETSLPYRVKTNSAGFRNAVEIDPAKRRILAVGDSYTFGIYMSNQDTWPAWLENVLANRPHPGPAVQVLNAGILGYTIDDELSYLRDKGLNMAPDLVILGICFNDICDLRPRDKKAINREKKKNELLAGLRSRLRKYSAAYNLISALRRRHTLQPADIADLRADKSYQRFFEVTFSDPDHGPHRDLWQTYETGLRSLIQLLKQKRVPLLLVVFPFYGQVLDRTFPGTLQDFIQRIAADTNTPCLDLREVFRQSGPIEDIYLMRFYAGLPDYQGEHLSPNLNKYRGDQHLSRYGHRLAAEAMADVIISQGLIPPGPQDKGDIHQGDGP